MTKSELLKMLERIAKEIHFNINDSIKRSNHMNDVKYNEPDVPQHIIDAILCNFINEVGTQQGLDYGLVTHHLYDEKE